MLINDFLFPAETAKADVRRSENILIDFFAGTIAGIAGVVVGHPFDTCKLILYYPLSLIQF